MQLDLNLAELSKLQYAVGKLADEAREEANAHVKKDDPIGAQWGDPIGEWLQNEVLLTETLMRKLRAAFYVESNRILRVADDYRYPV
jgi:hypothetical protein